MDAGEILEVVESTLGAMKPALAEVFRWRTTEDVSYKEIARRQDTNVNTALGRMHQATRKIRRALVDAGLIGGSA
jgi:DNA-directed RNA polymerase specialized sigma24 family protein